MATHLSRRAVLAAPAGLALSARAAIAPSHARAGNLYGLRLLDGVSHSGSALVSPFSVRRAIALAYPGAAGQTAVEMADTLALPTSLAELDQLLNSVEPAPGGGPMQVRAAEAIWTQRDLDLRSEYEAWIDGGGRLRRTDFRRPLTARSEINAWVAGETDQKITDLVPPGAPSPLTRLALVNALHVKAAWEAPFSSAETRRGDFLGPDGRRRAAWLMTRRLRTRLLAKDGWRGLALDYAGGNLTFVALLPDAGPSAALDAAADASHLEGLVQSVAVQPQRPVDVTLPRLRMAMDYELSGPLQALGLTSAFSSTAADFSRMSSTPLHLGPVFHKTRLSLDEQGSEAAAATIAMVETTSAGGPPPAEFRANRPFLFLIRDQRTGLNLFAGRVTETALA